MLEQAQTEHHNLPRLQEEWLDTQEITTRHNQDMHSEVMRRLNQEQRRRGNIPNNTMECTQLGPTYPAPKVQDTQLNEDETNITEEDDEEEIITSLLLEGTRFENQDKK